MSNLDMPVIEELQRNAKGSNFVFVLELYTEELAEQLEQLRAPAWPACIKSIAHTAKSSGMTFGATNLGRLAEQVDSKAASEDAAGLAESREALISLMTDTLAELEKFVERVKGGGA